LLVSSLLLQAVLVSYKIVPDDDGRKSVGRQSRNVAADREIQRQSAIVISLAVS